MESYTEDIDVLEASSIIKTPERPTTGKKRPRANLPAVGTTAKKCPRRQVVEPECAQCRHLLAEYKELRETNALLTEQLNAQRMQVQPSEAPRPGKISKEVAERYQVRVIHVALLYVITRLLVNTLKPKSFNCSAIPKKLPELNHRKSRNLWI